jgi:hypothetical protein
MYIPQSLGQRVSQKKNVLNLTRKWFGLHLGRLLHKTTSGHPAGNVKTGVWNVIASSDAF